MVPRPKQTGPGTNQTPKPKDPQKLYKYTRTPIVHRTFYLLLEFTVEVRKRGVVVNNTICVIVCGYTLLQVVTYYLEFLIVGKCYYGRVTH